MRNSLLLLFLAIATQHGDEFVWLGRGEQTHMSLDRTVLVSVEEVFPGRDEHRGRLDAVHERFEDRVGELEDARKSIEARRRAVEQRIREIQREMRAIESDLRARRVGELTFRACRRLS